MSSNAAHALPKTRSIRVLSGLGIIAALIVTAPVAAQDDPPVTSDPDVGSELQTTAPRPESRARPRERINLSVTVPREEADPLLAQDCEREAEVGRVAGEIVVCRQLGEASDGSFNKEEWEQDYARRTQGEQPLDTFGIPNHGNPIGFGSVPPPALIIDVEALPQAPAGSDADRIARGLPPLGEDPGPSAEEIARRRRALGLDAPRGPGQ